MTIEECIKQIKERVSEVSQIIKTALENNELFNNRYYDCKVSLQPKGSLDIDYPYLVYDIFARYKPQSQIILLDNILLPWYQLDNEEEILRQVEYLVEDNCKKENK